MYTLGIDIGSTTSKCVILKDGTEITATSIVVAGTGTKGPEKALKEVFEKAGITREGIGAAIATGYGRKLFTEADKEISELSCHARGVHYIFPQVRTIIDIGGQDAKVLALNDQGRMSNFLMNDKCAAGTGRFLDVMAGILQLDIGDLEKLAAQAESVAKISSTCTVFAESEVISQLAGGGGDTGFGGGYLPVGGCQGCIFSKAHRNQGRGLYERRCGQERRRTVRYGKGTGGKDTVFASGPVHGSFGRGPLWLGPGG